MRNAIHHLVFQNLKEKAALVVRSVEMFRRNSGMTVSMSKSLHNANDRGGKQPVRIVPQKQDPDPGSIGGKKTPTRGLLTGAAQASLATVSRPSKMLGREN